MNQNLLKLGLPNGVHINPNDLREETAKVLNGKSDWHDLFHYDASGRPINGKPLCRFVGGKGFVGFVSERDEGDIEKMMFPVMQAMQSPKFSSALKGGMPRVQILQFDKKAVITEEPRFYLVSRCIDKKDHRKSLGEEGRLKVLFKSLLSHAANQQLLSQGGMPIEDLEGFDFDKDVQFQVMTVRDLGLETQFQNKGKKWMHMMHAEIMVNVDLEGVWQMGGMTSRGHGLIFKRNLKGVYQACI